MTRIMLRLAAVGVLLATPGCGVRADEGVEVTSSDEVPFGLLEPDRVPVAAPGPGAGAVIDVFLFDSDEDRLVPVTRRVSATGLDAVVAELEAGPSEVESSLGLRSALIDIEAVSGVEAEGRTAIVDLADSFTEVSGDDQLVAIAQLVLSLTQRPGIDRVAITVEGESVEVPRGDGTLTRDALDPTDYRSFTPP